MGLLSNPYPNPCISSRPITSANLVGIVRRDSDYIVSTITHAHANPSQTCNSWATPRSCKSTKGQTQHFGASIPNSRNRRSPRHNPAFWVLTPNTHAVAPYQPSAIAPIRHTQSPDPDQPTHRHSNLELAPPVLGYFIRLRGHQAVGLLERVMQRKRHLPLVGWLVGWLFSCLVVWLVV